MFKNPRLQARADDIAQQYAARAAELRREAARDRRRIEILTLNAELCEGYADANDKRAIALRSGVR